MSIGYYRIVRNQFHVQSSYLIKERNFLKLAYVHTTRAENRYKTQMQALGDMFKLFDMTQLPVIYKMQ